MKEKLCFVSQDPVKEQSEPQDYILPNGECITISNARYLAPEALFEPIGNNNEDRGIQQMVFEAAQGVE